METQGQPLIVHRDQWAPEHLALICGIANAGGGTFIIDTNSRSYTSGLRKMRRPFEQIPRLAEKELGLECPTEPVLDGATLCLEVAIPAAHQPVAYEGVYWFYDGSRNIQSTREAVRETLDAVAAGGAPGTAATRDTDPWEMRQQPQAQPNEMNASEFLAIASLKTDDPDLPTDSMDVVFERRLNYLGLRHPQTKALTNAGVLLLHNQPERFTSGAFVQLQLFAQSDQTALENKVGGPLRHQLNESLRLLFEQYLPMAEATPGHTEDPAATLEAPPQEAVRGALLHALAHKDYEYGEPLVVRVSPDRITLVCPTRPRADEAPGGLAPSDAIAAGENRPLSAFGTSAAYGAESPDSADAENADLPAANPVLTNALRLMGIMDEWGESFALLATRCTEAGIEAPRIQQDPNGVSVSFPLKPGASRPNKDTPPHAYFSAPEDSKPPAAEEPRKSGIAGLGGGVPKNAPFSVRSIAAANNLDLTSTDEYVLRVLHTNGRATAVRIANVLGVSESTVRRSFRKLREHGFIERVGSDKAGYWRVID